MFHKFKLKKERSLIKNIVYLTLTAKIASAGPPIGPILGQCGIPAAPFCKDFNEKTKIFNDSTRLRVIFYIFINGEYNFDIIMSSDYHFLKNISELKKGVSKPGYLLSKYKLKKLKLLNKQTYLTPYMIYEYVNYKVINNFIKKEDFFSSFSKLTHTLKSIGLLIYTDI